METAVKELQKICNIVGRKEEITSSLVSLVRATRDVPEIRRGSSIRGAIDTADIFQAAHRAFNDDINSWLRCAGLAFRTKIELHDFSEGKFGELLKKFVSRVLAIHGDKKASGAPASNNAKRAEDTFVKPETDEKKVTSDAGGLLKKLEVSFFKKSCSFHGRSPRGPQA